MNDRQDTASKSPEELKKEQREEYNKKLSAKFYKFFSFLSFLVYYLNCTIRIISRSLSYYESQGVDGFIDWCRLIGNTSKWGEMARAVFDWYTITLLVFLVIYAVVFFVIFARFSPKRKKTFKYFKKSFTMARRFLKIINIALTLVVLINSAKLTSSDIASPGDKFTFVISVLSLLIAVIQIAFTIAAWSLKSKIKSKYRTVKVAVGKMGNTMSRYISHSHSANAQQDEQLNIGTEGTETEVKYMSENNKNNSKKSSISEKLGKIKSRFLRTLAALSLTDKEADEAMKEAEEKENMQNGAKEEQADSGQADNRDTERFENDYYKNDSSEGESSQEAADVIEPDENSVTITVDSEYKERYKKQKAEKRKADREDIKKKLNDFGDKVDEAGNTFTDSIKIIYDKVSSKLKPKTKKNDDKKDGDEDIKE